LNLARPEGLELAPRLRSPEIRLSGGRAWWAHFAFTRINTTPTILRKKIEDLREACASSSNVLLAALPSCDSVTLVVPPPQVRVALQVHAAQPTVNAAGCDAVLSAGLRARVSKGGEVRDKVSASVASDMSVT
jgi:hypothetical protein